MTHPAGYRQSERSKEAGVGEARAGQATRESAEAVAILGDWIAQRWADCVFNDRDAPPGDVFRTMGGPQMVALRERLRAPAPPSTAPSEGSTGEEPEEKPVAWMWPTFGGMQTATNPLNVPAHATPLYTRPARTNVREAPPIELDWTIGDAPDVQAARERLRHGEQTERRKGERRRVALEPMNHTPVRWVIRSGSDRRRTSDQGETSNGR